MAKERYKFYLTALFVTTGLGFLAGYVIERYTGEWPKTIFNSIWIAYILVELAWLKYPGEKS